MQHLFFQVLEASFGVKRLQLPVSELTVINVCNGAPEEVGFFMFVKGQQREYSTKKAEHQCLLGMFLHQVLV